MVLGVAAAIDDAIAAIIIVIMLITGEIISTASAGFFYSFAWFLGRACLFYELFHSLSR